MSGRRDSHAVCNAILWLLIAVYAFVTVVADAFPGIFGSKLNLPLSIIVPLVFGVLHGAIRYRITGIMVFLVLCLGISNLMENIGVMTGFPFGPYHYTDVLGPKLFLVPILIGPAYFGTGYVSWMLGNVLLGTDARRDALAAILVPAIAAFIMVGWDVCLDPGSSTIGHIWIWHKGGGYFGVPFTNYLGWYLIPEAGSSDSRGDSRIGGTLTRCEPQFFAKGFTAHGQCDRDHAIGPVCGGTARACGEDRG